MKSIAAAGALAALALCAVTVGAQQSNVQEVTYVTFGHPVELPGVTLEPGTYEFRLADSPQRNVIQVFRKDRSEVIGQWTFVQSERPQTTDETVVMFGETPEGTTPAVQYWYFPDEKVGKEFIYPDDQAQQIAARTGQRVRTDDGFVSPDASADARQSDQPVATSSIEVEDRDTEIAASGDADADVQARADLEQPNVEADASIDISDDSTREQTQSQTASRQAAAQPQPVGTSGQAGDQEPAAAAGAERPGELPRTASPLALTGLIGLLSLGGAVGLRRLCR